MTRRHVGLLALGCAAFLNVAEAAVTLNFNVPAEFSESEGRLNAGSAPLVFAFSVDGVGNVVLDASTSSGVADIVDVVTNWNGHVGTTSDADLFNSTFTLLVNAAHEGGNGNLMLQGNDGGVLAVQGHNSGRVDGAALATPNIETLDWSVASGDARVNFLSWEWGMGASGSDMIVTDADSTNQWENMGVTGNAALSGISMVSGRMVSFTQLPNAGNGVGVASVTFEVTDDEPVPSVADLTPTVYSGGSYVHDTVDGRAVWVTDNAQAQLYFRVPDSFVFVPGQPVYARIEYLDEGDGWIFAEYDSSLTSAGGDNVRYVNSETHARSSRVNGGGFVHNYQEFRFPLFDKRQNGSNDFRFKIKDGDGTPLTVASVQISTEPYADEMFLRAMSEPWLEPYAGEVRDFVDNTTLSGKVMTGYQGWFRAPNDVLDYGWNHWGGGRDANGVSRGTRPTARWMTVDAWPFVDDYHPDSLARAGDMTHLNGRPAYLFSSQDADVVRRHFRWMRNHGIDGAYLQYFVQANRSGANGAKKFVLDNVMEAANQEGRIWALEYDVSGLSTNYDTALNTITNDWNWMVEEAKITEDARYAHEDGKPVLFIWGFPVESREFSVDLANAVLDWFGEQDLYLICGTRWREEAEWQAHFRKYDQLLIWMERDLNTLIARKNDLNGWGMKILPHAWPGFSWHNLKMLEFPDSYTARNGGAFYWERLYNAVSCGADQIFLGMFDEYDEGTNIMPMSDDHPDIHTDWGHYIDNEGKSPFWYLELSEAAREMLNGARTLTSTMPQAHEITPSANGGADASCYLGPTNTSARIAHVQQPDGPTSGDFIGGQACRTNGGFYFYFAIDDAFAYAVAEGQSATVEMEYYDDLADTSLRLQYDSLLAPYKNASTVKTPGRGGWKRARWNVADAYFGNRQNGGSDFRVNVMGGKTVAIRRVSVFLPEEAGGPSPTDTLAVVDGGLEWPQTYDAVGWRLSESDNLLSNDWKEVTDVTFVDGVVRHDVSATNSAAYYRLNRPAKK